jgi:hypothetical protein
MKHKHHYSSRLTIIQKNEQLCKNSVRFISLMLKYFDFFHDWIAVVICSMWSLNQSQMSMETVKLMCMYLNTLQTSAVVFVKANGLQVAIKWLCMLTAYESVADRSFNTGPHSGILQYAQVHSEISAMTPRSNFAWFLDSFIRK